MRVNQMLQANSFHQVWTVRGRRYLEKWFRQKAKLTSAIERMELIQSRPRAGARYSHSSVSFRQDCLSDPIFSRKQDRIHRAVGGALTESRII